jgi:hypothetical protein
LGCWLPHGVRIARYVTVITNDISTINYFLALHHHVLLQTPTDNINGHSSFGNSVRMLLLWPVSHRQSDRGRKEGRGEEGKNVAWAAAAAGRKTEAAAFLVSSDQFPAKNRSIHLWLQRQASTILSSSGWTQRGWRKRCTNSRCELYI